MQTLIDNKTGDVYKYDEDFQRVFKNDVFIPETVAEAVFSGNSEDSIPIFVGILLKDDNVIITLSGNKKNVVDINQII